MSDEVMVLVQQLLPGFIAAWVFYGLTAHPRKGPFERIVQALIFTVLIKALVTATSLVAIWLGDRLGALGHWSDESEFLLAVGLALVIGLAFAGCANCNLPHRWLAHWEFWEALRRKRRWLPAWQWTRRTSFPSEWFSVFVRQKDRWVVLHLKGARRIYGFPEEWPDHAKSGHFVLMYPEWLLDNGGRAQLLKTTRFVVPATQVEMVEILYNEGEVTVDESECLAVQDMLINYNMERIDNGIEKPAATPE